MAQVSDRSDDWKIKRDKVLETAAKLFAKDGMAAVSMRDVGNASDLHISTLYYYFPSKSELYKAVCHWAMHSITMATMDSLHIDGTPIEKIRNYTDSVVRFLVEEKVATRILDQHFIFEGGDWDESAYPPITREPTEKLTCLLETIDPPALREVSSLRLAQILWDVIYGICKFSGIHSAVNRLDHSPLDQARISGEAWMVVKGILTA